MACTDIFPHRLKKRNIIFAGDKRKNLPVSFATRSINCTRKERICSPSFPRYNAMAFFSFSRRNRLNARMRLCGECRRLRFLAFAPVSETDDVDADASETSSSSSSSSAPDVALVPAETLVVVPGEFNNTGTKPSSSPSPPGFAGRAVSYTHLRAHET